MSGTSMFEHACCPKATAHIIHLMNRGFFLVIKDLQLIPIYYCPFCGEEL